jgi:predicted component of type VI protein secretion system
MEDALEGTVHKVFRPRLQPVQLAKAAAREMEEGQVVGPYGPEVPNAFTIGLHPTDFERFARYQQALQRELAKWLAKVARDRGWRPVSAVQVRLQADAAARRGRPRVVAQMQDEPSAAPLAGNATIVEAIERTTVQRRIERQPVSPTETHADTAVLVAESGERFPVRGPVTTIGRALENDVVIADSRVSRFHAEIRGGGGRFVVRDLGSTNGTLVANELPEQRELHDGDRVSFGGCELMFNLTD